MNALWWLALPVVLLPVWWHRQKRERPVTENLASARFLPPAAPRQQRVWAWQDRALLLVRCLLLITLIAFLAGLILPWRGDTTIAADLEWLHQHEREFKDGARITLEGDIAMPAAIPQFRHRVELRPNAVSKPPAKRHIAIVSDSPRWEAMFAADRFVVGTERDANTDLLIWDTPQAPPASLRAPLWWVTDAGAFPQLKNAPIVDTVQGRVWLVTVPADADAARALFEHWQQMHYPPLPWQASAQVLAPNPQAPMPAGGSQLYAVLAILFALERLLAHVRR
ncbi:MAG: hypothetical protein JF619_29980 [Massilia sp.]|nr:hypothetical protein [Massilia sp.]